MAARTLTKRNYILIANVLSAYRGVMPTDSFCAMVDTFCEAFKDDNPLFDQVRFKLAVFSDDPDFQYWEEMDDVLPRTRVAGKVKRGIPAGSIALARGLARRFRELEGSDCDEGEFTWLVHEILVLLEIPLDESEMGLTSEAWTEIYAFVDAYAEDGKAKAVVEYSLDDPRIRASYVEAGLLEKE